MKFKPYPKYKPSGVEIPSEIPIDWEINRGRFVMEVNPSTKPSADAVTNDFAFVPMESIGEKGELNLSLTKAVDEIGTGYTPFKNNDVIVAKITPCFENGKAALVQGVKSTIAYGTTELHVLRALKNTYPRFLFYVATSLIFRELGEAEMYGAGGQKRVPPDFCKNFRFALPSLREQMSIAGFLDQATKQMDHLIEKKKQLIERLKEKRAALISHTVTKGLPPQADRAAGFPANPKMKDSGIEWLGTVPDHWEVKRLKVSAKHWVSNVDKVPAENEIPIRLCNYTDVYYNDHITPEMGLMETTATADELRRFGLQAGDILITKDSEEWDDIAIPSLVKKSSPDLVCGYHLAIIRADPEALVCEYLFRVFQSCAVNQQFQVAATGVTRYGLPKSSIGEAWVPLPPLKEQQAIAAYLDQGTRRIDALLTKVDSAVERMKEYRTALINDAITGKIDVTTKMPEKDTA